MPRTKNAIKKTPVRKNNNQKNILAKDEILLSEDQVKEVLFDFQTFLSNLIEGEEYIPAL